MASWLELTGVTCDVHRSRRRGVGLRTLGGGVGGEWGSSFVRWFGGGRWDSGVVRG